MSKRIVVDADKCTGCRICELVCSVKHDGVSNPSRSRIRIAKLETSGTMLPRVCRQCEHPKCIEGCPTGARRRNEILGNVLTDHDTCSACKTCVDVCPYGGVAFEAHSGKIISCDLCEGDPICIKFCDVNAIRLEDSVEETVVQT